MTAYTRPYDGEISYVTQRGIDKPTRHPLHITWRMMNVRCYDDRHKAFHRYGGRGITVCEEWRWDNEYGLLNFIDTIGDRPEGHTLDRIDNDGNYRPDNCKWSTKKEQQNNLGIGLNNTSGHLGVMFYKHANAWVCVMKLNGEAHTVGIFNPEEKSLAVERIEEIKSVKINEGDGAAIKAYMKYKEVTPKGIRKRRNKTSQYYGVSKKTNSNKWRAHSHEIVDGKRKQIHLGTYSSEEEAYQSVLDYLEKHKK